MLGLLHNQHCVIWQWYCVFYGAIEIELGLKIDVVFPPWLLLLDFIQLRNFLDRVGSC